MKQTVDQKILTLTQNILPALRINGIPETPAIYMIDELATGGTPEQNLKRIKAVDEYLWKTEGKITFGEFKDLFLELINQR